MTKIHLTKSQSLVEVVMVAGIVAYLFVSIALLIGMALKGAKSISERLQAETYAQEAMEGVRNIRDSNLKAVPSRNFDSGISNGSSQKVQWNNGQAISGNFDSGGFALAGGAETINDGFIRSIDISGVGTTKLTVTVRVTWNNNRNSIVLMDYLTNWQKP